MLRQMLRDARRNPSAKDAATSLAILVHQVHTHEREFRFLTRERYGGVNEVRRAINTEIQLFVSELTVDLSRIPGLERWKHDDLEIAAELIVGAMFTTVVELLDADSVGHPGEDAVITHAEKQLRLIILGMATWNPTRS